MKQNFAMTINVQIDEEVLADFLSNAVSGEGCGWWKPAKQADYDAARAELVAEGIAKPCLENVWARMLLKGGKLRLLDPESEWHWSGHKPGEMLWKAQIIAEGCEPVGGKWHNVGIRDILRGIQVYAENGYANDCGSQLSSIVENGDSDDADVIIQIAMYGDVIYE
jgi:hypothetical protein